MLDWTPNYIGVAIVAIFCTTAGVVLGLMFASASDKIKFALRSMRAQTGERK